jgi:hypothetical protein
MQMTSTRAELVDIRDVGGPGDGVTATVPRAEFEAALASEQPAELVLDVARTDGETQMVEIAWSRSDLERLLDETPGDTITLAFEQEELERLLSDVEGHGLREKALVLTVAVAAAAGGASSAAAHVQDEASLSARGITPSIVAVHDEASLAERGIVPLASEIPYLSQGVGVTRPAPQAVAAEHDEATLAARGITPVTPAEHDEATLAARGITPAAAGEIPYLSQGVGVTRPAPQAVAAEHDEATLAARGITPAPAAEHDEATLAARGITPAVPAEHDEATLAARGITPAIPAEHDEATLAARGIEPTAVPASDGGSGIEVPALDATTLAAAGGLAALGLAITAAGFAVRRQQPSQPA